MLDPTVVVFSQARRMQKNYREDEEHAVPEYEAAGIEYPADIHALDLANPGTFRIDPRQHSVAWMAFALARRWSCIGPPMFGRVGTTFLVARWHLL